ncbi:MAG: hypothetical protein KDA79_22880 [Planctomycetaceae bacterium]|nr:hypothetical protein [Planctomycetaceae bacterium]
MTTSAPADRMPLPAALKALSDLRTSEIVVTTMGAAREWVKLSQHPHDFVLVPSSMGQAPAMGLGMALARPRQKVIVCNGDGSMLMNLGVLVSITAAAPKNLMLVVFENGVYEVTGQQPTPGSAPAREDRTDVDYAGMARSAGFSQVHTFDSLADWSRDLPELLKTEGPVFVVLKIEPMEHAVGPRSPGPGVERVRQFRAALAES